MSEFFLSHLADFFQAGGLGTVAQTIFENQLPPGRDGLLLRDTGGGMTSQVPTANLAAQVTSRFTDPVLAKGKAWAAYRLLNDKENLRIGGPSSATHVTKAKALPPFYLGVDADGKTSFVFNVKFLKAP